MPVIDLTDPDFAMRPVPTAQRPLLGQTVLLVEDSRYASEAVRLLAMRSGARIRRADCIASAERHLNTYRAGIAIVDLGLPDGSGLELIARLAKATQRPTVLLGTSGQGREEIEEEILAAGADGFLPKPIDSLAAFQNAVLRHLPDDHQPKGLRLVGTDIVEPDKLALAEDLVHASRLLEDTAIAPRFVADFIQGIARTGRDDALRVEAEGLAARTAEEIRPALRRLIEDNLEARAVI